MHNAQRETSGWHPHEVNDLPLNPFFLLPRNQRFFKGESRYLAIQDRSSIAVMLLMLIVFFVILGVELHQQAFSQWLAHYGKTTSGTILSRYEYTGKGTTYRLTFQFQAVLPGKPPATYQHTQDVSGGAYAKHLEGAAITVVYQADDPTNAELGGADSDLHYYDTQLPFFGLFILIIFGGLVYLLIPIYRDSALADKGAIIAGAIVDSRGRWVRSKQSFYRLTVTYGFISPTTGQHLTRTESMRRNDLKTEGQRKHNVNLVNVGTPVAVLYLNDRRFKIL